VSRLVDKSLVVVDRSGGAVRYRMPETIRQYAAERLGDSGEAERVRDTHRDWYLAVAESATASLQGPDEPQALARLDAEHDNLRAALQWTLRGDRGDPAALRLCAALWRYWHVRSHHSEGSMWMEAALALGEARREASPERAQVLYGAGSLAIDSAQYPRAERMLEECLAIRRAQGDTRGIAHTLTRLGFVARCLGDNNRAAAFQRESLALCRELGDDHGIAHAVTSLGVMAADEGDYERAASHFTEALAIYRKLAFKRGVMITLHNLGELAQLHGDPERAEALVDESLALSRELADRLMTAYSTYVLGKVANDRGDHGRATALFERALSIHRELGDSAGAGSVLDGFACAAAASGDARRALRLAGAAESLRNAIKLTLSATERAVLDRYLDRARSMLAQGVADDELSRGRMMTLDEAVALALGNA
jgi:tetratricopeptide (TPR) repeat protein